MEGTVVALGTFDGVHLGHQRIIKDAISYAKRHNMESIITTFDPHPQQFLVPERGLKLLTMVNERKKLIKNIGKCSIKVFKFSEKLRKLSSEQFVKQYLIKKLKASVVFVGYDYAFGSGRHGAVKDLRRLGKKYGFIVKMVKPFRINGQIVKSSNIREMISKGKFRKAVSLLGHPYILSGKVIHGAGRGRLLGYPTANLIINQHKLVPSLGVYAGRCKGRKCLVNIGSRPTFGPGNVEIEVLILKFNKNLYDKNIEVELHLRLRDEIQFSDVYKLKEQIRKDIAKCLRAVI